MYELSENLLEEIWSLRGFLKIEKAMPSELAKSICALALTRIGDLYVWVSSDMTDLSNSKIQAKDDEAARAIKFRDSQYKYGFTDLLAHDCSGFIS